MLSVPVMEKVSFEELDVPVIVTEPPLLDTDAVESMLTNSARPAWMMVRVFDSTPDAEKVAVVVLDERPVWLEPVHDTVSFPLPLCFEGVTHDAYAIYKSIS